MHICCKHFTLRKRRKVKVFFFFHLRIVLTEFKFGFCIWMVLFLYFFVYFSTFILLFRLYSHYNVSWLLIDRSIIMGQWPPIDTTKWIWFSFLISMHTDEIWGKISILHWLLLIVYLLFFFGFYFEHCKKKIPRNWKSIQLHFKRNVVRAFNFYVPNWIECMHYICSLMLMDQTRWIFDYVSALGVHMIFSAAHFFSNVFSVHFSAIFAFEINFYHNVLPLRSTSETCFL